MSRKKLLWYIFPTYFLIIIISLVPVSIYMINQVQYFFINQKTLELEERAHLIESLILNQITNTQQTHLDSICQNLAKKSQMRITIILPDGLVIGDSDHDSKAMDNHATRPEIAKALDGKIGSSIRFSNTLEKDLLYVAVPVKAENQIIAVIRTSVHLTYIESTLLALQNNLIFAGVIIAIIAVIISLFVAKRITNPIEDMKIGVSKFAQGELDYRLPVPPSKELAKLAESLNAMASQLDDKMKKIIEQKNEQQAVLESMVEGVIAVDKTRNIINFNQAAADMFKIDQDAIGKDIATCIKNKDVQDLITKTLEQNEPVEEDIIIHSQNKQFLQGNGTVLKSAQGQTVGALIVINDVTRLRRLEQVRQDFVANVSHEIRTPLTSIKGFAETLLDGAIEKPKEARNFVEIIDNQSNRLNAIIEDLLILARLEQEDNRDQIKFSEVLLKNVISSAAHVCRPSAKSKNIKIEINCDPDLKIKLNSDLFEQALVNLIDNAIKYSPKDKKVNITAKQTSKETIVVVSDQGSGIDKKHLPRLFERFYRVDKARSRSIGGTGLGLAIVKHIAQVHNGKVSVESEVGSGSKFKITIPFNSNNQ